MVEREENIERVKRLLSEKIESLKEEEIDRIAKHIYEMSFFLVCLMKKRVSTNPKRHCNGE